MSKPTSKQFSRAMFDKHRRAFVEEMVRRFLEEGQWKTVPAYIAIAFNEGRKQGAAMAKKGLKP